MNYYVVIDTNVLVSAMLKWESVPGNVVSLAFDGPIIPVLNQQILKEYREVLLRPKFQFPTDVVDTVIDELMRRGIVVDAEHMDIDLPDPKDRVFYEVVMEVRKDDDAMLVTGNLRHFPEQPFVVTPRQLLNLIFNESAE